MTLRGPSLRIGEVARRSGVSVDTVRFYEREGLLGRISRRSSGLREFSADTLRRLAFIREAAALGFSLAEIRELLALRVSSKTTCEEVQRRARTKLNSVDARIAELEVIKAALERVTATCASAATECPCPFLEMLGADDKSGA